MSYWYRPKPDWAALRRAANANLVRLGEQASKPKPEPKSRLTELQRALPYELELGAAIIERRELRRGLWGKLIVKQNLTAEEHAALEELDHHMDQLNELVGDLTDGETRRLVRIYNKSRKVKA